MRFDDLYEDMFPPEEKNDSGNTIDIDKLADKVLEKFMEKNAPEETKSAETEPEKTEPEKVEE